MILVGMYNVFVKMNVGKHFFHLFDTLEYFYYLLTSILMTCFHVIGQCNTGQRPFQECCMIFQKARRQKLKAVLSRYYQNIANYSKHKTYRYLKILLTWRSSVVLSFHLQICLLVSPIRQKVYKLFISGFRCQFILCSLNLM